MIRYRHNDTNLTLDHFFFSPATGKITLRDLKACRMTPVFFNTFINIEKYLEYEQRDPVAQAGREEMEGAQTVSDWERYAADQYEILLQEEQYEQEE